MDMRTLRLENREGDRVRYVPESANGDPDHHSCQDGTIVAFRDELDQVVLKLDADVDRVGWEAAAETFVAPSSLRIL